MMFLAAIVFVSNERAGTITAIDSTTDKVVKTIAVGARARGMALSPDGHRLYVAVSHFRDHDGKWVYVTGETSNTISVIDARSNRVVNNVFVDARPRGVLFGRDDKRAYITCEVGG